MERDLRMPIKILSIISNFSPSKRTNLPPFPICYFFLDEDYFLDYYKLVLALISSYSASFSFYSNISESRSLELSIFERIRLTFEAMTGFESSYLSRVFIA